ncbi:MAG: CDP-alcohol phosphatidyltransferase family protein [Bacteroidales bacterium]|nr:CDP-alcohol phosphatidyltransferase family protein [Bacteroidales bacterium]
MGIVKHIPNTITSMNLLSGAVGVILALEGWPEAAFVCMLAAAVFDFCDGLAARLLGAYSPVGKELDSLADVVSFGLLPSIMLVTSMEADGWWRFLPLVLAAASALRLARFNTDERQTTDFLGVPTPASAMVVGSLCCFIASGHDMTLYSLALTPWFLPVVAIVMSLLVTSGIPMFGMKIAKGHKLMDAKRIVFLCIAAAAIAATIILGAHWSLAVFLVFASYIIENLILALI